MLVADDMDPCCGTVEFEAFGGTRSVENDPGCDANEEVCAYEDEDTDHGPLMIHESDSRMRKAANSTRVAMEYDNALK